MSPARRPSFVDKQRTAHVLVELRIVQRRQGVGPAATAEEEGL